jgi:hypothetical protein
MHNDFKPIVIRNIIILFDNVRSTLAVVTDQQMQKTIHKWPLWKQFYHVLHSMDQWFINPAEYSHPALHEEGMHAFEGETTVIRSKGLSKTEITDYFELVAAKTLQHFKTLNAESLFEKPNGCPFIRLELVIGQMRHGMYNIGLIHEMLREDTGKMPEYVGPSATPEKQAASIKLG